MRRVIAVALLLAVTSACNADDDASPAATSRPVTSSPTAADPSTTTSDAPPPATGPVVIAHRGASAYAPEHTFAAYDRALEMGADYLEQDLQITADGELVVLHDDTLDRTARGPADACTGPVSAKTLAQLRQCDVGTWFNETRPERADPSFVGLTILTLREVFEEYGDEVRYYIEIKSPEDAPGMEQALLDLLEDAGPTGPGAGRAQVLVQSFSADSLRTVHALRSDLPLVQLVSAVGPPLDDALLASAAEYAVGIGPPAGSVDSLLVEAAHRRCLVVHPYTVDDPGEMGRLLDAGVDGIFTNATDVLVAVVAGRPPVDPATASCPG